MPDPTLPASPLVSVIVPVWRDSEALMDLLATFPGPNADIVVCVPCGESGQYAQGIARHGTVRLVESPRGRASQLNAGAAIARGRWLLFLHADSRLPEDWHAVVADADSRTDVVGGAFRFSLDSPDFRARLLERAVRLRVRLLQLPYGDQGIFVRRRVFDALGGYADLPLMEDVELMRRLRSYGRLHFVRSAVVTSARRWMRDGWCRRSATNVTLAAQFLLGVPPARLAQRYFGRRSSALVIMGRAPGRPGKARLHVADLHAHRALREALFFDTLDAAAGVPGLDRLLACDPPQEVLAIRAAVGPGWDVIAQRGTTLGDRMVHAFDDVFRLGYDAVVIVGSDLPDLPRAPLEAAQAQLASGGDCIVLGPATDGGYYLVGLTRRHPELFRGIDWGTSRVLAQTREAAARARVPVVLVEPWTDVDSVNDLAELAARTAANAAAPRTRAWLRRFATALESVE